MLLLATVPALRRWVGLAGGLCSPAGFTITSISALGNGFRSSRDLPAVFTLAFICFPARSTSFLWASMNDSVACRASAANSVFLIFLKPLLCLPPVALAVSSAMTSMNFFWALTKFSIPSRASSARTLRLIRLPGLGCLHPGMSLLSGDLQKLLLHVDESLHATPQQVRNRMRRALVSDPFLHAGHQDFMLFQSELKQYLLPLNEIGYALPGYFAKNGRGRVLRIGQLLPHRVHDACILPHGEIQEDPLRSKETLYALLGPTGKKRNKGRFPRMSSGGLAFVAGI